MHYFLLYRCANLAEATMSLDHLSTELVDLRCPYCDASIHLIVDPTEDSQEYTEDCEVCCQPMVVMTEGDQIVRLAREDE